MRSLWLALGLCLCATTAQAQIQQGSFKLSIDTDLFTFSSEVVENSDADAKITRNSVTLGPGGSATGAGLPGYVAFAFGYVAHPHVIPQLHASLAHGSGETTEEQGSESDSNDDPSISLIMLRPELEIPFNPDGGVVGYGLIGFDFRHVGTSTELDDEDFSVSRNSYGPVFGVGMHVFLGDGIASFDLGAQFSYLVQSETIESDGDSKDNENDLSAKVLSITAGFSIWP